MGKSVSEVLFRWIPIEHQYSDSLALGATAELTDNTINYNKIYIENIMSNFFNLAWPGNSESGKTSYYAKANADLTKGLFVRSSVWMTTGTPFLLSFVIDYANPKPKYSTAPSLINKAVTFSCKGCQGGLPKIETIMEYLGGSIDKVMFFTRITLPNASGPWVSTKLVHIPGRVFTIAYERLLHSDIVTYKTFWNFVESS